MRYRTQGRVFFRHTSQRAVRKNARILSSALCERAPEHGICALAKEVSTRGPVDGRADGAVLLQDVPEAGAEVPG